jgi:hypothetical protein
MAGCSVGDKGAISVDSLINNAAQYDMQSVRVCGLLIDSLEYCGLRAKPLPEGFSTKELKNFIWVSTPRGVCMPGKSDSMQGTSSTTWVVVEGVFHTGGEYGHFGGAVHEIKSNRILVTGNPCI